MNLLPLNANLIADFLHSCLPAARIPAWKWLFGMLTSGEHTPLLATLSSPLGLSLLRQVYIDTDNDPAMLADERRFPTESSIIEHMLSRLITALSQQRNQSGRWTAEYAERCLTFLAQYMQRAGTRDLAWWQLQRTLTPWTLYGVGVITGGAATAIAAMVSFVSWRHWDIVTWPTLFISTVAGGVLGGMAIGRSRRESYKARVNITKSSWRESPLTAFRSALLLEAVTTISFGIAGGAAIGLGLGQVDGIWAGIQSGLAFGLAFFLIAALSMPGLTYLYTVALLAAKNRVPIRFMAFLSEVCRWGVLREAGVVYQFSHYQLQDFLAPPGYDDEPFTRSAADRPIAAPAPETRDAAARLEAPATGTPASTPTKLNELARSKVLMEVVVLPEMLLRFDEQPEGSREAVEQLAASLLNGDPERVERAATAQYARFANARRLLVDAARLSRWSRPASLYRMMAWITGGVALWAFAMRWVSPEAFRLALAGLLLAWLVVPVGRAMVARVIPPKITRPPEGFAVLLRNTLSKWPVPLLAIGLTASFMLPRAGKWPEITTFVLATVALWLAVILLHLSSAPHANVRKILSSDNPADWMQLPSGLTRYRIAAEQAYRDWISTMAREGLMPMLREQLGEEPDAFTTVLPKVDTTRLGSLNRMDEFVETAGSERIDLLIRRLGSASIGVSGARGAGKSTTLRQLCATESPQSIADLRMLVQAPTAYDPKEFITYLFIKVCERITGDTDPQSSPGRSMRRAAMRLFPLEATLAGVVIVVGSLQWPRMQQGMDGVPKHILVIITVAGALLIVAGLVSAWWVSRRARTARGSSGAEGAARGHLQSLRYMQALTNTRTGEVSFSGGVKLGGQAAVQRTERDQTYPKLVADFRDLLDLVGLERRSSGGKVIIGIDELDKIGSAEDAERFLNDLKAIFGVRDCYYLVALSEDALSAFDRRSLAIRNTFDSAFDKIVKIPPLSGAESRQLLTLRGVPLPYPYLWLCHTLSGGLPRDLLRAVIDLASSAIKQEDGKIAPFAVEMIQQDRRTVLGAQLREAAQITSEESPAITEWLAKCMDAAITATAIDDLVSSAPSVKPDGKASNIVIQTRVYLSILAVLAKVFVDNEDHYADWLGAQEASKAMDGVAEVRSLLAIDPFLAWHTLVRIREQTPGIEPSPRPAAVHAEPPVVPPTQMLNGSRPRKSRSRSSRRA